jgi:transcriptional regulator with XRE-family HTH domain
MIDRNEVCRGFGKLLKQRRTELKLSQKDFARAVGLSRTSITNIERGRQPVSLPSVYAMADALQADVGDLLPTIKPSAVVPRAVFKKLKHVTSKQSNWLGKLAELGPQKRFNAKN